MSPTYASRSRSRPLGITVLCALGFLGAFLSLLGTIGKFGPAGPIGLVVIFAGLALVVAKTTVLYGLWTLQRWGYRWALRLYGLSALFDLVTFSFSAFVVDVLVIGYIASKSRYFR